MLSEDSNNSSLYLLGLVNGSTFSCAARAFAAKTTSLNKTTSSSTTAAISSNKIDCWENNMLENNNSNILFIILFILIKPCFVSRETNALNILIK